MRDPLPPGKKSWAGGLFAGRPWTGNKVPVCPQAPAVLASGAPGLSMPERLFPAAQSAAGNKASYRSRPSAQRKADPVRGGTPWRYGGVPACNDRPAPLGRLVAVQPVPA